MALVYSGSALLNSTLQELDDMELIKLYFFFSAAWRKT